MISRNLVGAVIEWLREEPTLFLEADMDGTWTVVRYAALNGKAAGDGTPGDITDLANIVRAMRPAIAGAARKPGMGEAVCHLRDHVGLSASQTFVLLHELLGYTAMQEAYLPGYLKNGRQRLKKFPCRFPDSTS